MISFVLFPLASLPSVNWSILAISIRRIQMSAKKSPFFPVHTTYSECCGPRLFCVVNENFGDHVVTVRQTVLPSAA